MDIQISEFKDSVKINKSSVGVGWEAKIYRKENETDNELITRLKKTHLDLLKEFPSENKVKG